MKDTVYSKLILKVVGFVIIIDAEYKHLTQFVKKNNSQEIT